MIRPILTGPGHAVRSFARRTRDEARRRRPLPAAERERLAEVIAALAAASHPDAPGWEAVAWRAGDPTTIEVASPHASGRSGGGGGALVRIADGAPARAGLHRAAAALAALRASAGPAGAALLPEVLGQGLAGGRAWLVERRLSGVPGRRFLADPRAREAMLFATVAAIRSLQAPIERSVDAPLLEGWLDDRAARIAEIVDDGGFQGLADRLRRALTGRVIATGWIHGDLWPGNVLVDRAGGVVTGIVDWDSAAADEPLFLDRLHLALTTRRLVQREPLGRVIATLLTGGAWTADDRVALGGTPDEVFDGLAPDDAVWLGWLQAIAANLERHPQLGRDRRWLEDNVRGVLACL
jgi:Phosphotransferase enzyme family